MYIYENLGKVQEALQWFVILLFVVVVDLFTDKLKMHLIHYINFSILQEMVFQPYTYGGTFLAGETNVTLA